MKRKLKRYFFIIFFVSVLFGEAIYQYKLYAAQRLPLDGKVVIIDPGHGGWDPGKTGMYGDDEKNINLVIAHNLKFLLEMGGAQAVMTRYEDTATDKNKTADLKKRISLSDATEADIMISIHQNSFTSPRAKGAQVFYYRKSEKGRRLAECIQNAITEKADKENTRTAKENENYYLLKNTSVPSVIVECGFLSNKAEEQKLNSDGYQQLMAWSIYSGVL
ncbi:MAG: N-acetylmuramoyl-L-alanine amidase [Firmicutes bacterium]|nr:N-acetylmuramoyl-L-alanine amidase [Bacillota bacterium]